MMIQETMMDSKLKYINKLKCEGRSKSTIINYSKDIEDFIYFMCDCNSYDEVTEDAINKYKVYLLKRLSGSTVKRKLSVMKGYLRYIYVTGIDPATYKHSTGRRYSILAKHEVLQILSCAYSSSELNKIKEQRNSVE